jgi:hypothetical protein
MEAKGKREIHTVWIAEVPYFVVGVVLLILPFIGLSSTTKEYQEKGEGQGKGEGKFKG